jgi:hypothetical protein
MMRFLQRIAINPDQEVLPFGENIDIFAAVKEKIQIRIRERGGFLAPVRRDRNDVSFENPNNFLTVLTTSETYARLSHPGGAGLKTSIGKQIHIMRSR